MAYQQKDNEGRLFRNEKKQQDSHADYEGSITVAGVDYWLKAWINEGQKGKWMKLAVTPKQERARQIRQEATQRNSRGSLHDDLNDDIIF